MALLTLIPLTIGLVLGEAYAKRQSDYWGWRSRDARRRGVKSEWYAAAAMSWHKQLVFWSNLAGVVVLFKWLCFGLLFLGAAI